PSKHSHDYYDFVTLIFRGHPVVHEQVSTDASSPSELPPELAEFLAHFHVHSAQQFSHATLARYLSSHLGHRYLIHFLQHRILLPPGEYIPLTVNQQTHIKRYPETYS